MGDALYASGNSLLIPDLGEVLWSVVCLAIIAVAVWRLLPKFTAILDERTETIENGLEFAAKSEQDAAAAEVAHAAMLTDARAEAARIREDARNEGAAILAETKNKAQAEADRIAENAARAIEAERQQAMASLRSDVGELATELASRIVGEALSDEVRQSRVVDRFLDELDSASSPADLFQER